MDITEVALAAVTDEFISYTRQLGPEADLDETTSFIVIAATLVELKALRLLPRGEEAELADWELLETRDLLFARLLQYRAYKKVAEQFAQWQRQAQRRYPRAVELEERFAALLPPVRLGHDRDSFAQLAAGVFRPRPVPEVSTSHIHAAAVSVPEQAGKLLAALHAAGPGIWLSFDSLTADCQLSLHVVGRFLALLELYKARAIDAEQSHSLGPLHISWTGISVDPAVVAADHWHDGAES